MGECKDVCIWYANVKTCVFDVWMLRYIKYIWKPTLGWVDIYKCCVNATTCVYELELD